MPSPKSLVRPLVNITKVFGMTVRLSSTISPSLLESIRDSLNTSPGKKAEVFQLAQRLVFKSINDKVSSNSTLLLFAIKRQEDMISLINKDPELRDYILDEFDKYYEDDMTIEQVIDHIKSDTTTPKVAAKGEAIEEFLGKVVEDVPIPICRTCFLKLVLSQELLSPNEKKRIKIPIY